MQMDGSLLLQSSVVRDNEAWNGIVSVNSVNSKISNTSFIANKELTTLTTGGILYIAQSALFTSITTTVYLVSVTNCNFTGNSFVQGNGGAINVNSLPGKVTIDGSVFFMNKAMNGGAIAASESVVKLTSSNFFGNKAQVGGGAIYWIYSSKLKTTYTKCHFNGNNASYGDQIATNLVTLNASFLDSNIEEVSGQALKTPIMVNLLDYYSQVVKSSESVNVFVSIYNSSSTLKGSTIVNSVDGVSLFSNLIITGIPGAFTQLTFSVAVSGISAANLVFYFRNCISGEITLLTDNVGPTASCYTCTVGTFSFYPTDSSCQICSPYAQCPGGNVIDVNANYWRSDTLSSNLLQCPVYGVCLGGSNVTTQCKEGTTGPYCSVCGSGYVKNQMGVCYSCTNSESLFAEVISAMVFTIIILIVLVMYRFRERLKEFYRKRLSKQFAAMLTSPKYRFIRVKIKIIVAFFQIVFSIGPALNIVFPSNFTTYVSYYSIFQLNLLFLPDVNCLFNANYYTNLVFTTLSPIVLFVFIAAILRLVVLRAKRLNARRPYYTSKLANNHIITVAFVLSYFVLVNVSIKIFQVFQCETFDNGEVRLVADYSIDCLAPNRSAYLTYAVFMMFVYPIGIPLVYAIILIRNRHKINPNWRLVIDGSEKSLVSNEIIQAEKIKVRNTHMSLLKIRNLFDSYTPKRWYFEIFDCIRRLLLGAIPVLIARGTFLQIIFVLVVSLGSIGIFMQFTPCIYASDNQVYFNFRYYY